MKLLPSFKIVFYSSRPVEDILKVAEKPDVGTSRYVSCDFHVEGNTFEGQVSSLRRTLQNGLTSNWIYRSAKPKVHGEVVKKNDRSVIYLSIYFNKFYSIACWSVIALSLLIIAGQWYFFRGFHYSMIVPLFIIPSVLIATLQIRLYFEDHVQLILDTISRMMKAKSSGSTEAMGS